MTPESLQSLSVAVVAAGLFLAALGGFGAFHFGHKADRAEDRQRTLAVQKLGESVASMEMEQRGLRAWISAVDQRVTEPAPHALPTAAPAVAVPAPPPIASTPIPAIAEGPPEALTPPKLRLPNQPPPTPPESLEPVAPPEPAAAKSLGLGAHQRATLIKRLRAHPHHGIAIHAVAGDPQALELATALESAFHDAGWQVSGIETSTHLSPTPGLLLSTGVFPPREEFIAAYSALERAGFLVTSDLDPNQSGHRVVLTVGPKY